jgi:uncharacterized membrane protein
MKWLVLALDILMIILGLGMLLYAYGRLRKLAGNQEKERATEKQHLSGYRFLGWCILVMGAVSLLSRLFDRAS